MIGSLCEHLVADGWKIVSRAMPNQRGTDVVATRAGIRLEVEAKGAGSSKPHTARYGQLFDQAQVRAHVGEAVLKALAVVSAGKARPAIAFPDGPRHRSLVGPAVAGVPFGEDVLVLTQVAGSLHGGSRAPRSEHLQGDIGEQPRGQPDMDGARPASRPLPHTSSGSHRRDQTW